ncbi:MAG: hypothetical protein AAB501_02155 [Patescibacteria group bacterium]
MKSKEPIVLVPPVVVPVEIQVALTGIAPEFGHVAIAVAVLPDRNVQNIICATIPQILLGLNLIWGLKARQYFAPNSFVFKKITNDAERRRTRFHSAFVNFRIRPFKTVAVNILA